MLSRLFAGLLLSLAAGIAAAQAERPVPTRPADTARLAAAEAALGRALHEALMHGPDADIAVLVAAMDGGPAALAPAGDWRCRTIKLGGPAPLVAYGTFDCRITEAAPGIWHLVKLTGSQRMEGRIYAAGGSAAYRGVAYVDGGPATGYDGLPPDDQSPVEPGQTVAQVGTFEQMGRDRARLLLPDPILESGYDILYLTR